MICDNHGYEISYYHKKNPNQTINCSCQDQKRISGLCGLKRLDNNDANLNVHIPCNNFNGKNKELANVLVDSTLTGFMNYSAYSVLALFIFLSVFEIFVFIHVA